jgi:hypothetical protein
MSIYVLWRLSYIMTLVYYLCAQCDLLIGADGVKSSFRRCMLEVLARGMDADVPIKMVPACPVLPIEGG